MTDTKSHWDTVYENNDPLKVSWYQEEPKTSLELIAHTGADKDAGIIDVGGGASAMVDRLLERGHENVAVLDISEKALACARARLGDKAGKVEWLTADVTRFQPAHVYEIWHDRAVLHFLTNYQDRMSYIDVLKRSLSATGHVIIGAFAIGGPERCSNLPVVQYDADKIQRLLGEAFRLEEQRQETHVTPGGKEQEFAFFRFQRQS
jgi:SAM-dependent methyltransferase